MFEKKWFDDDQTNLLLLKAFLMLENITQ